MFTELYRESMAKRLLRKSTSFELEKRMVQRLRLLWGGDVKDWELLNSTSKLERMIKDGENMDEEVQLFQEYLKQLPEEATRPELEEMPTVRNLTDGLWPSLAPGSINLPPALAKAQSHFETFFRERHSGKRRLTWRYAVDDVEVVGTCVWWGGDGPESASRHHPAPVPPHRCHRRRRGRH